MDKKYQPVAYSVFDSALRKMDAPSLKEWNAFLSGNN